MYSNRLVRVMELAKGKYAVEVGAEKDLVATLETIKVAFVIESLLTTQKPVAICGDGACGKSSLIKDFIFN